MSRRSALRRRQIAVDSTVTAERPKGREAVSVLAHMSNRPVEVSLEVSPATRLDVIDVEGIAMSPMKGLHLSEDTRLNYLVSARRP